MDFVNNAIYRHYLNGIKNKKTIMSKERAEMYRQDFQERHEKALSQDINNLSDVINAFYDYKSQEQFKSCELWENARKAIDMMNEIKRNIYNFH